jgi:succinate dehydrogenase/fumarate reductase flavoprotein subunit
VPEEQHVSQQQLWSSTNSKLCIVCLFSQVLGGQLVTDLQTGPDGRTIGAVVTRDVATGSSATHEADAAVFAIGITGMQKLVQQCRLLGDRQEFRKVNFTV